MGVERDSYENENDDENDLPSDEEGEMEEGNENEGNY